MKTEIIERLLCLLDVRMHALALCEVSRGTRLKLPAMDAVLVHYVLRGQGVLRGDDGTNVDFGQNTLLFLPLTPVTKSPNLATSPSSLSGRT